MKQTSNYINYYFRFWFKSSIVTIDRKDVSVSDVINLQSFVHIEKRERSLKSIEMYNLYMVLQVFTFAWKMIPLLSRKLLGDNNSKIDFACTIMSFHFQ